MSYRVNLSLLAAAVASLSSATELTFSDLNLSNYGTIPAYYGDNVTGPGSSPTGTYNMGLGWTPNITTTMQTVTSTGAAGASNLDYWSTDYGDLRDVAFSPNNGQYAQITLIPEAGFAVNLISFDLGGWSQSNLQADRIRVLDSNGSVLWSAPSLFVNGAGPSHSNYSPNIVSSTAITIEWGSNWNIGIDNVSFAQQAVPEPASMAALGLGLAALVRRRRR